MHFDQGSLRAEVLEALNHGRVRVRLTGENVDETVGRIGRVPLPPYIRRKDTPEDRERYQTVYARRPGAVAAPTAGLHFTGQLLDQIRRLGVDVVPVMLHIGPGTFRPVREQDARRHRMEAEYFEIGQDAATRISAARDEGGRILAVGTTTVRALETAAQEGDSGLRHGSGWTEAFIYPPYAFRAVDVLITNFHLPRSTLLMLVCAFAGAEFLLRAYRSAVERGYRFYSYGDAMMIL